MASHRPTKKLKIDLDAKPAPVSSGSPVGIHLSPELVARIATYVDITNSEVMNICLAVGPIAARPIRNCYLKRNVTYLNTTLKQLLRVRRSDEASLELPTRPCRDKAGANHKEWMEVNTDWKTIAISDEEIENHENIQVKDAIKSGDHPFVAFNNAAFAVELGLIEVVEFLIEDKGVDPNTYCWTVYRGSIHRLHLIAIAMHINRCEIFQYLVSLQSMTLWAKSNDAHSTSQSRGIGAQFPESLFEIAVRLFCTEGLDTGRTFVEGFLAQPQFDINFQMYDEDGRRYGLPCLHLSLDSLYSCLESNAWGHEDTSRVDPHFELIKTLLDAGADVSRSYRNVGSAIRFWRRRMKGPYSKRGFFYRTAQKALRMIEQAESG